MPPSLPPSLPLSLLGISFHSRAVCDTCVREGASERPRRPQCYCSPRVKMWIAFAYVRVRDGCN